MDATTLAAFVVVAAVLTVTPGADMALVAHTSLTRGRRAAWVTTLGVCAGLAVHAVASSVGLSSLLARSATAYMVVKTAGAIYLIILGILAIRASLSRADPGGSTRKAETPKPFGISAFREPPWGADRATHRGLFATGLVSNVLNPKVALFYLTFLPQFVDPTSGGILGQSLLLAAIHLAMGLVWLPLWALAVDRAGAAFGSGGFKRWLQRATGGILVLVGAKLLAERAPSTG